MKFSETSLSDQCPMVSEEDVVLTEKNLSDFSESVTTVTELDFEDRNEKTTAILGKISKDLYIYIYITEELILIRYFANQNLIRK